MLKFFYPSTYSLLIPRILLVLTPVVLLFTNGAPADEREQLIPLEPEVAAASSEGEEAMRAIRIPEGWQIQLFASEPDVANVVAFDIDHLGRMIVCETFRQNQGVTDNRGHDDTWLLADLAAETVQDRIDYHKRLLGDAAAAYTQHDDRLRRLEDADQDGVADSSVLLASGFNHLEEGTGAGVLAHQNNIYYTCIPKLWKLIDHDNDGTIDDRISMADGFGVRVAFRGHDLHGLVLGPDGRLYFSIGDRGYHVTTAEGSVLNNPVSGAVFRCELNGSNLEVYASGLRNPQELAFNDAGDFFTVDNNSDSGDQARVVHLLEGGDSGWRMYYQYLPDRGPFNRENIWKPFHQEQPAYIVPPVANFTDGPSGLAYYPGTGFGDYFKDKFLICDFRGGPANSGVRSFRVEPDGAFYRFAENADPIWRVLATDIGFGTDGSLYLSDWVDGWDGLGKGRIYKVAHPEFTKSQIVQEVQQRLADGFEQQDVSSLLVELSHVDRRIRLGAQWELASRKDWRSFATLVRDEKSGRLARLHAIWGVDQIARQDEATLASIHDLIRPLLDDTDPYIRAAAAKFAGERLDAKAIEKLRDRLTDESARVRFFSLLSLGKLKDSDSLPAIIQVISEANDQDPALRHAGVMALSLTQSAERLEKFKNHPSEAVRRAVVVSMRRLKSTSLVSYLDDPSSLVALEAARAIYDLPIPAAMPGLGATLNKIPREVEYQRRSLNANYRIGTPEAAKRIAEFAASALAPTEMRSEALQLLEDWDPDDPRDRVLNDYRPLPSRSVSDAVAALNPNLESLMVSGSEIREESIRVASQLGIQGIAPMLETRVKDESLDSFARAGALDALVRLDPKKAVALASDVKSVPPSDLLISALRVLAKYDEQKSLERLITATRSRNTRVRQLAWDLLAEISDEKAVDAIRDGVQSYLSGDLSADVWLNVLEASTGRLDAELQSQLADYQIKLAREDQLGPWLHALSGGDASQGEKLFFEATKLSCLRCHQVGRSGGQVGPDLTTIGASKDRRYLLESICLPNSVVARGFETSVILTDEGRTISGIVKEETEEGVDLLQSDGTLVRVPIDQIEARRQGKSSMPDDLVEKLTDRQLRDLVAYLASLQQDLRGADEVE
ncbi:HEAT repeat domain-containing protein [bacterium]|nr:HEAT repeat domain-containing protein [bacterium]